jgi:hypothetical protein
MGMTLQGHGQVVAPSDPASKYSMSDIGSSDIRAKIPRSVEVLQCFEAIATPVSQLQSPSGC